MKVTRNTINVFEVETLSGARNHFDLPARTEIRHVEVDMNDPIYGEPVTWLVVKMADGFRTVGAINLPVLAKGWQKIVFEKVEK